MKIFLFINRVLILVIYIIIIEYFIILIKVIYLKFFKLDL